VVDRHPAQAFVAEKVGARVADVGEKDYRAHGVIAIHISAFPVRPSIFSVTPFAGSING
jgi:hypothetical protein